MGKFSPNIIANSLSALEKYNPNGDAICYGEDRITWKELATKSRKISQALIKIGVKKGDKVAFVFHNTPQFIELNLGIQIAGAIPAPLNYRLVAPEIEFQTDHCDAEVFVFDSIWNKEVEKAAPKLTKIKHFICFGKTKINSAIKYETFVNSGIDKDPRVPTFPEEAAVMIYTGGTTGFPKGVLLSFGGHVEMLSALFANLVVQIATKDMPAEKIKKMAQGLALPGMSIALPIARLNIVKKIMARQKTTAFIQKALARFMTHPEIIRHRYKSSLGFMFPSMPLFHDASYSMLMLGMLMCNVHFILIPGVAFSAKKVFETIGAEKPFFLANVPTGWKKMAAFPGKDQYNLDSVKIAATGAGMSNVEIKKKMFKIMKNALIVDMFGQTEMTPVTTFKMDADPSTLKDRSVGRSIVDIKIVNEQGNEVLKGEHGEILYKSSTVMMGYYKDEKKTGEAMDNGWFKSGDLGFIDKDGEVRLLDRKKECINTGGEKVFPLEVEGVISVHNAVENVCVIGVPDEEWGSKVSAVVQLFPGKEVAPKEIIEFCRGKIAGYKIPKSVVFVDEFPMSPVGKVLRAKVREQYGQA